jgi:hypothetical protein
MRCLRKAPDQTLAACHQTKKANRTRHTCISWVMHQSTGIHPQRSRACWAAMTGNDDENKEGDHALVMIVALIVLAALFLAALLLFCNNEGLLRCRDKLGP